MDSPERTARIVDLSSAAEALADVTDLDRGPFVFRIDHH